MTPTLHFIFDGPPGPVSGRFVEVETPYGRSVRAGEWKKIGKYWHLVLTPRDFPTEGESAEEAREHGQFGVTRDLRSIARWALLGDDCAVEPVALKPLIDRIETALREARKWVDASRSSTEE